MTLGWGILGTGRIAQTFTAGLRESHTGRLVAVGSRDRRRAGWLVGERPGISFGSYDEAVAHPAVEAVYIALPNHLHAEWVARAARAGKHVLCEKPFALNAMQAAEALDVCAENDVFCMEAFMYRCHPQLAQVRGLLDEGIVGEVRAVDAAFGANVVGRAGDIRDVNAYGGGAILDLGSYCTSMARTLAGAPYAGMHAFGAIGPSGVDVHAIAVARFANDVLATLTCARDIHLGSSVSIHGSTGTLRILEPWIPSPAAQIEVVDPSGRRTVETGVERSVYAIEADLVAGALAARQAAEMTWADTLENARMLDDWRAHVGLVFEGEPQPG